MTRKSVAVVFVVTVLGFAAWGEEAKGAGDPKADEAKVAKAESCQRRFQAACKVLQRCAPWASDLGGGSCDAIDSGCSKKDGVAPYSRKVVDYCVAGIEKIACPANLDPNDADSMDFEAQVSACKLIREAETK